MTLDEVVEMLREDLKDCGCAGIEIGGCRGCRKREDAIGVLLRGVRRFPIQDGPSVAWSVMAPHEAQCVKNHQQTLERIAQRGGFSAAEAFAVVHGIDYRDITMDLRQRWYEFASACNRKGGDGR